MKRNGRSAWQIEEEIGKVIKAAFSKNGYGEVAFDVRQETGEYYEILVHQDGEIGGVGAIDFRVMQEINEAVEVDSIQPDFGDYFCFEVRVEGD